MSGTVLASPSPTTVIVRWSVVREAPGSDMAPPSGRLPDDHPRAGPGVKPFKRTARPHRLGQHPALPEADRFDQLFATGATHAFVDDLVGRGLWFRSGSTVTSASKPPIAIPRERERGSHASWSTRHSRLH